MLSILTTMIACCVAVVISEKWLDNRPLDWEIYDHKVLTQHLRNGEVVLLFIGADWCPTSVLFEQMALDDDRVINILREHNVKTMHFYVPASPSQDRPDLPETWGVLRGETAVTLLFVNETSIQTPLTVVRHILAELYHEQLEALLSRLDNE